MIEKKGRLINRSFVEVEAKEGILIGTPIVYDKPAVIGGLFEETIERGAIQPNAITKDTALYYNHNINTKPLCRVRTGKLKLEDSADGVKMEAHLNLDRSDCKDLYLAVRDGDIDKMSFCFRVEQDEWDFESDPELPKRRIKKISYIKEVSAVDEPAYEQTDLYARKGETVETDLDALENARAEYRSKGMQEDVETELTDQKPIEEVETETTEEKEVDEVVDTEPMEEEPNTANNDVKQLELEKEKALALLDM